MTDRKLTLVPAGPRCPSEPFRDSRERTRSHRGSSVTHTKSTGKEVSANTDAHTTVAYQMLTEAFINC